MVFCYYATIYGDIKQSSMYINIITIIITNAIIIIVSFIIISFFRGPEYNMLVYIALRS